jgi:hypothetical protein
MSERSVIAENLLAQHLANPFLILEMPITADVAEIERQGGKLVAMLGADFEEARQYATPFGAKNRTAEAVRHAMAELRDPRKRLLHEWWAREIRR